MPSITLCPFSKIHEKQVTKSNKNKKKKKKKQHNEHLTAQKRHNCHLHSSVQCHAEATLLKHRTIF